MLYQLNLILNYNQGPKNLQKENNEDFFIQLLHA